MDESKFSRKVLNEYLSKLTPEDYAKMGKEKVEALRAAINPFGRTIEGSNKFLNFSFINLREKYIEKLITTAVIGYLNRGLDEYLVPDNIPVTSVYDYLDNPDCVKMDSKRAATASKEDIAAYELHETNMKKKVIIKAFLESMFEFNPNEHARAAYRPNRSDPLRSPIITGAAKRAIDHLKSMDSDFKEREEHYERKIKKSPPAKKTIIGRNGKKLVLNDKVPAIPEKVMNAPDKSGNITDDTLPFTVRSMMPAEDYYYKLHRYLTSHYEQLRESVRDIYGAVPDVALAINAYSMHNSREEAESFKVKHADSVIATIYTADTGKWCVLEPFKASRESVNYFNKETRVLEEMVKQKEIDEKMGRELMKKRVRKQKKKNIETDGEDAPGFSAWRNKNSNLQKFGAEHVGQQSSTSVPDDAIECPVWKATEGGKKLESSVFYTKAVAPPKQN